MAFDLTARLDERRARQRFRQPTLMDGPCGRTAVVDGREHLNFCANDYLGLAGDPEVVAAFRDAADRWGVGSGASHLVCGHQRPH
ncbi:MAG TPA: 8-amino-7-oxononanoate synthase, partial [Alcanivorax sp.]|nr:8-amino-7-oxononanoate synthase [Alcanivorax sp.]